MAKEKIIEKDNTKSEAIKTAIASIEKEYGKGSIMTLGSNPIQKIDVIPTGALSLDIALGVMGVPRGRIIEIMGPESSGKSTLAMQIVSEAQKFGGVAAYIDVEQAMDLNYAKGIGVNVVDLLFSQPNSGEEALEIVETLTRSNAIDVIVVDSVAALTPQSEIEGAMGDPQMGTQARLMSQALRKLISIVSKSNTCLIFVNQIRCLPLNTLLLCNGNITPLQKIKKNDYVLRKYNVYNMVLEKSGLLKVTGKKIYLKNRGYIELSNNHRHPVISGNGVRIKKACEITIGDWFIQPILEKDTISNSTPLVDLSSYISNIEVYPNSKKILLPTELNEDFAFFLGCYYSDGYMLEYESNSDYRVSFTAYNKEKYKLIFDICKKLWGEDNIVSSKYTISVGGRYLVNFLKLIGINKYGKFKIIPEVVLKSNRSIIMSFLRGVFFDTYGFTDGGFIFTNENHEFILQIYTILYYMGIFADVIKDDCNWYNRLYITGEDAVKFSSIIGFAENTKQTKCKLFTCNPTARGKYDVVPYDYSLYLFNKVKKLSKKGISNFSYYSSYKLCLQKKMNCSRFGLISFLEEAKILDMDSDLEFLRYNRFCEVINIEVSVFDAIDIEVSSQDSLSDNYFIANGFLTHNSKIGVMFGNPETTTGGNALKFYSSVRLDTRKVESIKVGPDIVGVRSKIKVIKNKVAPPFRETIVDIIFGKGISSEADLCRLAVLNEIIDKSGTWYSYEKEKLGQGEAAVIEFLQSKPEFCLEIKNKLLEKIKK